MRSSWGVGRLMVQEGEFPVGEDGGNLPAAHLRQIRRAEPDRGRGHRRRGEVDRAAGVARWLSGKSLIFGMGGERSGISRTSQEWKCGRVEMRSRPGLGEEKGKRS